MKLRTLPEIKKNSKYFTRALLAFILSVFLGFSVFTISAFAAETTIFPDGNVSNISEVAVEQTNPGTEIAPTDPSLLYDLIGVDGSQSLEMILLITILSVAPSILLMMTSYTRIIIVFSFLRNAMQTQTTPPNQVLTSLALFLTIFTMWPIFSEINTVAYQPYERGELTGIEALKEAGGPIKTFMLKQTTKKDLDFFVDLAQMTVYAPDTLEEETPTPIDVENAEFQPLELKDQVGLQVVIPAFMVSELSRAFQMGFLIFIPFLVIDITVSSTLMSLGMMMLPPAMISLPFKIMLFVLVDGWELLVGTLYKSFNF